MASTRHSPRWPNRAIKPPCGAVEIDWAHPLAWGLRSAWFPAVGAWGDLVASSGHAMTTATLRSMPNGDGPGYYRADDTLPAVTSSILNGASQATWLFDHCFFAGTRDRILSRWGNPYVWLVQYTATTELLLAIRKQTNDNSLIVQTTDANIPTGQVVRVGITWVSPSSVTFYVNGRQCATSFIANNAVTTIYAGTTPLGFLKEGTGTANSTTGYLGHVLMYDRALPPQDVRGWTADPYCLLRPVTRRRYGFVGAGGEPPATGVRHPWHGNLFGVGSC